MCYDLIGLHSSRRYVGLLHFSSFLFPSIKAHVWYDLMFSVLYDTISNPVCLFLVWYDLAFVLMYDINLWATTATIPSIRGIMIPIYLVSSTMDSIRRSVVLFKPVLVWTSDPKSEFLWQSSLHCAEPADPPLNPPHTPGISPTPLSPCITRTATVLVLWQSTSNRSSIINEPNILVTAFPLKSSWTFHSNITLTQTSTWLPLPLNT